MKQRDRFTFLRSYYEMFKHLKTKKDQALFINSILSAQFSCTKLEVLPEFSPSLQMALEAVSYQINSSIEGYTKHTEVLTPKQTPKPTPKATPKKKEIEIEIEEEYIKLNKKAFSMWVEYKGGNRYSKQGRTLSRNKLMKYSHTQQQEMVENSIMNTYKGLIEPKQQTAYKPVNNKTNDAIDKFFASQPEEVEYIDARIN